ncbi:SDR family oxidoreductase [Iamia majanohamensis]|uniref:SDR family oxidoreductase n=1 Tax=Iamia majanohamensis TaxID=467976 RepID=A0AAF0BUR1_9ACTN|nr:SDR family oxidoreductase [Iamia majanohamensis]WCO66353.1 SDR family oxidoreductase [Iamia majanohamensis]
MPTSQTVLVTGATGYIGGRLVPELLAAGHRVRCLVRTPAKLADAEWHDRVEVVEGDLGDGASVGEAMEGVDSAYFLVHSMGGAKDFAAQDREFASTFRDAAAKAGVSRLVYLGGLGDDDDPDLSDHLKSRHEVGRVLADGPVPVTELRAAVIIGSGSASFEMLRSLVEVLPAMVTPRWVRNRCQPIAIRDVLFYLVTVISTPEAEGRVLEVGGADVLSYADMMRTYAEVAGLKRRIIRPVPVLTPTLSSRWVGLVTPLPAALARPLVESLISEVYVTDRPIGEVIPHDPVGFERALELALRRISDLEVTTRWSDAALPGRTPADPLPTDPDWSGGRLLLDEQEVTTEAPPEAVFATVEGIGGDRGWYVTPFLWSARGVIDKLVGGVGMRRGRRHPDRMGVGDAVDFWRVEAVEPPSLVRLRAEMRLPGEAWLEWRIDRDDGRTRVRQRALFHPRGLLGRAYWYVLVPFHVLIFKRMCHKIVDASGPAPDHVPETTSVS